MTAAAASVITAVNQQDKVLSVEEYAQLMNQAEHAWLHWEDMYRILLSVDELCLPVRGQPVENPLSTTL